MEDAAFPLHVPGDGTNQGMSQRALIAAIMMHAELVTDGVPGEACDALVAAAHATGREVEDQMAVNAVLCADALLRALSDEPRQFPLPVITYEQQVAIDAAPLLFKALKAVKDSAAYSTMDDALRHLIDHAFNEYDAPVPF